VVSDPAVFDGGDDKRASELLLDGNKEQLELISVGED
jgi:hypothetical protein